jgi:hypothetical protein
MTAVFLALLRFADLRKRGFVNSWPQLKRMQQLHGFPVGRMLSPNIRAWTEEEVHEWFVSRPAENFQPLKGAPRLRHERRKAARDQADRACEPVQAETERERHARHETV